MRPRRKLALRTALVLLALALAAIIAAPYVNATAFQNTIRAALESSLQRRVTIGAVHYSLFPGPGFTVEDVNIADVPSAGVEPFAHVAELKAGLRLTSLVTGRVDFATLRLYEPTVNLVRPGTGGWNIKPVVNSAVSSGSGAHTHVRAPDIEVRSGRINFKFGDTKSVFYISNADVDVYPNESGALVIHFAGDPTRTDHGAQGFGRISGQGMLRAAGTAGDQLTVGVHLERSSVEELCHLLGTGDLGVHGGVVANAHITGPVANPQITGDLTIDGLHRWDLLPSGGNAWTVNYRGAVDLRGPALDLETVPGEVRPQVMSARLHASELSSPHWNLSVIFNGLPAASLIDSARRLGAPLPGSLQIDGKVTGAIGYAQPGGLEGQFALSSSSITAPGAAPVRADGAQFTIRSGVVSFGPADVLFDDGESAQITARFDDNTDALAVDMSTRGLVISRLRAAASSLLPDAPVPLLDSASTGSWRGSLSFSRAADAPGVWSGSGDLFQADVRVPGVAVPLHLDSANVVVHGPEVTATRVRGHAGRIGFEAEYRFSGKRGVPDRARASVANCDLADLQRLLAPTLQRREGLLARLRLRGAPVPDWLKARDIIGTVRVTGMTAGDIPLGGFKAALRWDGPSLVLKNASWALGDATGAGTVTVSLAGADPAFTLAGVLRDLPWREGTLDIDGRLNARGADLAAFATATAEGNFTGHDLTLAPDAIFDEIAGTFRLASDDSAPRLVLDHLQARNEHDSFTGQGASQPDGRIALDLVSAGRKPVRYVAQGFLQP